MSRCKHCRKANLKWIEVADGGHLKWILVDRRTRTKHSCEAGEKARAAAAEEKLKSAPPPWWVDRD